jgi:hypothetical protein
VEIMNLPRVTEILRAYTGYENVPTAILDKAASRGTTVHALCAAIANGSWIPESMIDEELRGYVRSFTLWAKAQVKSFEIVEKRFQHESFNYTGQVDFVVIGNDDERYLVDIKTSSKPQKTHPVQMGAYDLLLRNNSCQVKGAMLVYLNKEGEFPNIHNLENLEKEEYIFICALNCWHYFNKGKKDKQNDRGVTHGSTTDA